MAPLILVPDVVQRIIYFLIHGWDNPESYFKRWTHLPDAGQYASVSLFWQDTIERKTFAELHLDLDRLSQLNSIVTPRRRGYVRTIQLNIALPFPGPRRRPETENEKLRNNGALQATLEAFLRSLSQWDANEVHKGGGVTLSLNAPILADVGPHSPSSHLRGSQWKRRYEGSVLELTYPERIMQLAPVMAITKLERKYPPNFGRYISPVAMCALLAKLPTVKHAGIDWWKGLQFLRMRNDLADTISQINHPMNEFELCDPDFEVLKESHLSLTPETLREGEEDRLSKSIHILSQRLKKLDIYNIAVSDEIFFPRALSVGIAEPRWDRLVIFSLYYPPVNPSGDLLFLPDPHAYQSSESEASISSDAPSGMSIDEPKDTLSIATPVMQQFYLAAARAALQMPALRDMSLVAELGYNEYWHKFSYNVKGGLSAKALWTSSSGFIPEDEVLECWRKVPRKHLEAELEVELSDDKNAV
ncbi:hypothetical protein ACHAQJ_000694 [Trichoderma viride]